MAPRKNNLLLLIAIIFMIFSVMLASSELKNELTDFYTIPLQKGQNSLLINFSLERFVYAADIIYFNPDVEVISFQESNKTIGYVNVFGGIGKNFMIEQNKTYEVISSRKINLIIPK